MERPRPHRTLTFHGRTLPLAATLLALVSLVAGFVGSLFWLALVGAAAALALAVTGMKRSAVGRLLRVGALVLAVISTGLILTRAMLPSRQAAQLAEWWQEDVLPDQCEDAESC